MNRRQLLNSAIAAGVIGGGSGTMASGAETRPDYGVTGVDVRTGPPAEEGYFLPAEWQPHERTLMQFLPGKSWYRSYLSQARKEWATVANMVGEFEPVTMAVNREDLAAARKLLGSSVELFECPMDDGWCRDSGPMILVNGTRERRVSGFTFNGWGAKYPPYDSDALVKARLAKQFGMVLHPADMVCEGGAVHVDGEGTAITTEQCLLHTNRNPDKSKAELDVILKGWLGVEKVIWLPKGLMPDPITDGHVDGLAAFAAPGVVLLHTSDDDNDVNKAITAQAKDVLAGTPDARGRTLEVIEVPLTSWDVLHMNFYICNGGVIVPVAGNAREDDVPLGILREVFPNHKIVPVAGRHIARGGGGVHCITQQMPSVQEKP